MNGLIERVGLGGTARDLAVALAIALAIVLAVYLTTSVIRRRVRAVAERTPIGVDDLIVDVLGATRLPLTAVVALWAGAHVLVLPPFAARLLERAALIALFVQLGIWAGAAIRGTAARARQRKVAAGELASVSVIGMMALLARVATWVLVLLLILENLGVDITALVAGLGIGGIAIALAAQNLLGDLFASISIIFEKPFMVGDAIAVGDLAGTVEQIGLKTTRVRSTSGEELILPNGDLLSSRLKNFRRLVERRVFTVLGVTYETPRAELAALPDALRSICEQEPQVRVDRVHVASFGASAIELELVYFVRTPDYGPYMDARQRINLAILAHLEARGVGLAYPTHTIHVAASGEPPAEVSSPA